MPLQVITEQIRVRGEDSRERSASAPRGTGRCCPTSTSSCGGSRPATDPSAAPYGVSLSWTALQPGRTMDAVLAINQAQNFAEFREAAALLAPRRRTWSMPTRRATSATSWPGRCRCAARATADALAGLGRAIRLAGDDPVRRAALGLQPAERLARGGQPAGDRRPVSLSARLGILLRLAQPGDHRPAARDLAADPG